MRTNISPLECFEHDLYFVSSMVEQDLTKLLPASEINPAEEDKLEEIVWAGFQGCVEAGCIPEEQANAEFYVWRNIRLGHSIASHIFDIPLYVS